MVKLPSWLRLAMRIKWHGEPVSFLVKRLSFLEVMHAISDLEQSSRTFSSNGQTVAAVVSFRQT